MSRRALPFAVLAVAVVSATAWTGVVRPARRAEAATLAARAKAQQDYQLRTDDIAFYIKRSEEDPQSAEDRAMVAGLLLQRAREGGGRADWELAERYATASLALRSNRNGKARLARASALLAQHNFAPALVEAQRLVAEAPEEPRYRSLLAELHVEMGNYDAAGAQFDTLTPHLAELAVAPRYARYLEFRGESRKALRVLEGAAGVARMETDLPREQVAWFGLRLADAQMRSGLMDVAARTLGAALTLVPDDMRLWSLKARWHAQRREWRDALNAIDRVGDNADIQTMALAGDAWSALGDSAKAAALWGATDRAALENPEPFNRQWTLFRLEHGIELTATRALLERESLERRDVFGLGQLALARVLTGDPRAAVDAIQGALAAGTADPWLWYVAGRVEEANGRAGHAATWYRRALEMHPQFHHRLAADAERRCKEMDRLAM